MEELLSAAEMKKRDLNTIHGLGIPSLVLMERAAFVTVEEMIHSGKDLTSVLVVCGSGNNGGDGFAVARILKERGISVTLAFVGKESSLTEETRQQKQICEKLGICPCSNWQAGEYTAIVDAVFGIGLSRKIEGEYAEIINWINSRDAWVTAVDIPSGISADTGQILGTAVRADLTVTFQWRKTGQLLYPGFSYCGNTVCREIGIWPVSSGCGIFAGRAEDLERIPARNPYSNKGSYGKVLLIAGSEGMSGAALLSARGACRSGCGLVRIFSPECNRTVLQTSLPEAMVTSWDGKGFPEKQLTQALEWADVIGIGPGLGTGKIPSEILRYVLEHTEKPLVIDADGLNILAVHPEWMEFFHPKVVITPHVGEFIRLTGRKKEEVLENLVEAARSYAGEHHLVCVLKDAHTVTANAGQAVINTSGNSGMATGGSGDVLTGVICSLLAQKMEPFDAAFCGVLLHGMAGDLAAEEKGTYGMLSGDIAEHLGTVLKKKGSKQDEWKNHSIHPYGCCC